MLIFLGVALLIYGSMHFYAFRKVWHAFAHSRFLKVGLVLTGIILTISPVLARILERQGWERSASVAAWISYSWMGYVVLFFCIGLVFDGFRSVARLMRIAWMPNGVMTFRIVAVLALAMLGYGFVEARDIRVERITITTPKLASGRITIAQISDLHLGSIIGSKFLDRVMAQLAELKPDIIVATRDIVDGQGDRLNALDRHFHAYKPPLGAYAVTGNHEYHVGVEHSLRFLHRAGFTVLRGDSVKTGGIVLAGVDDHAGISLGQNVGDDARKALTDVAGNDYVVLLKHRPIVKSDLPFDLQLSGHTHGGQMFPFSIPTRLINGVPTGMTKLEQGRQLYVSRGVGTWGPPIRLFVEPEITLITIESSNK